MSKDQSNNNLMNKSGVIENDIQKVLMKCEKECDLKKSNEEEFNRLVILIEREFEIKQRLYKHFNNWDISLHDHNILNGIIKDIKIKG